MSVTGVCIATVTLLCMSQGWTCGGWSYIFLHCTGFINVQSEQHPPSRLRGVRSLPNTYTFMGLPGSVSRYKGTQALIGSAWRVRLDSVCLGQYSDGEPGGMGQAGQDREAPEQDRVTVEQNQVSP